MTYFLHVCLDIRVACVLTYTDGWRCNGCRCNGFLLVLLYGYFIDRKTEGTGLQERTGLRVYWTSELDIFLESNGNSSWTTLK